jgi:hypothetical protein
MLLCKNRGNGAGGGAREVDLNAIRENDLLKGNNISQGMGFYKPGVILRVKQNGEPLMIGQHQVTVRATVCKSGPRSVAKAVFSRAVYTQLGIGVSVSFDNTVIAGLLEGKCRLSDDAEVLCKTKNVCDKGLTFSYGGMSPATKVGEGPGKKRAESQRSTLQARREQRREREQHPEQELLQQRQRRRRL